MKIKTFTNRTNRSREGGQVMLFTVLGLGIFLIGAMAFAIDVSNMWFNRQSAQTAADAACTAAAMDMLVGDTNGTMPTGANFTAGSSNTYDCNSASPVPAPCSYASLNGYSSSLSQSAANSGTLGDNVFVDFPAASSVGLSGLNVPPTSVAAAPLVRVQITSNIPTWFAAMLKGMTKQSTGATAICGVIQATSPIPILVLNPTIPGALSMNGGGATSQQGDIAIAGGPAKSIQVNSDGSGGNGGSPVSLSGNPSINLCSGGGTYCGSTMGVWGTQSAPGGFWNTVAKCTSVNTLCTVTQTAPQFNSPSAPIADPLASTPAPAQPTFATFTTTGGTSGIIYHQNGCPDTSGCHEFSPGYYPNGINVQGFTAIFDPGLYYIGGNATASKNCNNSGSAGSLCELSGSCIRPSTVKGDGSGGTMFYFADSNSIGVGASGGGCSPGGGNTIDPFSITTSPTTTGTSYMPNGVKCTSSSIIPTNLTSVGSLTGSVLLAPCNIPDSTTGECAPNCSLNYGDPLGAGDPNGVQRGILFFQDRAVNASNNPSWSGSGSMLLAGTMYFHQCVLSGADTGQGCVGTAYNDLFSLGGTPSSSTYVLGDVIADKLSLSGNAGLTMDLNPSAAYTTLKAALVQ
jgi:Flp pilus assembly protein TadG